MKSFGRTNETAVDGMTIVWSELGEGESLVLLHGLMDSHRTWRKVAPLLARQYRVLMPDLAGHGYSGRPDAPYTLTWHAQMIADWMAAINIPRAHIVGHSYGGGIAQWMLLEHRERIERLALVSAGGLGRLIAPGMHFASFPVLGRALTPLALRHVMPKILSYIGPTLGNPGPEEQARFLEMQRIPGTEMAFQRSLEGVINFFGQYVQTIQRSGEVSDMPPVALFWGSRDPIIPVRHGRRAAKRAEDLTLTEYPDCGHFPQLEAPAEFARDLTAFLADPHRRPARLATRMVKKLGWPFP